MQVIFVCNYCGVKLKFEEVAVHYRTKNFCCPRKKNYKFELKNRAKEIIGETIVDEKTYNYIKKKNIKVSSKDKNYACVVVKGKKWCLHRFIYYEIYKHVQNEGMVVDHINSIKLDNRAKNLRELSYSDNSSNKSKRKNTSSKYYGVSYCKLRNIWKCGLTYKNKKHAFYYKEELHAAYHYNLIATKLGINYLKKLNNVEKPDNFVEKVIGTKKSGLPFGVYKTQCKKYKYAFQGKEYLGFLDPIAASNAREKRINNYKKINNKKLLSEPIMRNSDNIAILELFDKNKNKVCETMVDDENYYELKKYSWCFNNGYVKGNINNKSVLLSRYLMNSCDPKKFVDHIDNNVLNNQKSNLREVSPKENSQNRGTKSGFSSKYIGVFRNKKRSRWESHIYFEGKRIWLGSFKTEKEAASARDKKVLELNKKHHSKYKQNILDA
jgi:hypothetical protein